MTAYEMLLLITAFLSMLVGGAVVYDRLQGPDPEPEDTMCVCGLRGGASMHRHGGWVQRHER